MDNHTRIFSIIVLGAGTCAASAELITFDEFDATNGNAPGITNQYADMGITFVSPFTHTWDGANDGDPGFFGLIGTNGPQFLGVRSPGAGVDMRFDAPIFDMQFDVAPAILSFPTDELSIVGYRNGQIIDTLFINASTLGNQWMTINFDGLFDRITLNATGFTSANFAVDNMSWLVVPAPSSLALLTFATFATTRRRRTPNTHNA